MSDGRNNVPPEAGESNANGQVPATDTPRIRITDAVKKFGDLVALNSVSLEVPRGEVVLVIGPSVSG